MQCFAAFVSGRGEGRFAEALSLTEKFDGLCLREGYHPVRSAKEVLDGEINALLTVEEGGAIEGDLQNLDALYGRGVRMMGITWNYENELGFPNFTDYEGLCAGRGSFAARESRGLKPAGIAAAEKMTGLGMIIDVSHASDGVFEDVAQICKSAKLPFVASHSGSDAVHACARNLTDGQIKKIADCGGVVGIDFCADFLSADKTAEGQREAILAHIRAIFNAGGEEAISIGSDFDGIPENPFLRTPADMPLLFEALGRAFGCAALEKFAYKNFLRVFGDVCG